MKKLPKSLSNFAEMRKDDFLYVDKTEHIYHLVKGDKYYFLFRPRRFGKTLLLSTLAELFAGNKKLFDGLWISTRSYSWEKHPIIHIDFSKVAYRTPELFEKDIISFLIKTAKQYDVVLDQDASLQNMLSMLVEEMSKKGRVVVLIDEYDHALLKHLPNDKDKIAVANREILSDFFTTLKGLDKYLRFVFVTGVTKFSHASIFSGANNLNDISLKKQAATLLGYTHDELVSNFGKHIDRVAHETQQSREEVMSEMAEWYNGYCFSKGAAKVYNPFSIMYYLDECDLNNYWAHSGTPSFLARLIKNQYTSLQDIETIGFSELSLGSFEIDAIPFETILFQSGYLTIAGYDRHTRMYTLSYPNKEVEQSLKKFLLTFFANTNTVDIDTRLSRFKQALAAHDMQRFCTTLQTMLAGIPYTLHTKKESYYHSLFQVLAYLLDYDVHSEVMTSNGRIDLVISVADRIYIFEFKFNGTAREALEQIDAKRYADKFMLEGKQLTCVGLTFNFKKNHLELDWFSSDGAENAVMPPAT